MYVEDVTVLDVVYSCSSTKSVTTNLPVHDKLNVPASVPDGDHEEPTAPCTVN